MPPSSLGVNSQHHKNPSSSSKSSLSLKGILTRATHAMKSGSDRYRKTSTSAGNNIGKGSGSSSSTPVRPRSPATLPKKMEGSRNFARSNSVPKKIGAVKKSKERDTMSICSIEDNLPEHLPDPVEIIAPQTVVQSTVEPQEPNYTEKVEDKLLHEEVMENSIVANEGNPTEENHHEINLEETKESPKEVNNVKVIEECREEQCEMEEETKEKPVQIENVVIGERQEEETLEIEPINVVEELIQETENVVIVEKEDTKRPEEAVTELPKEPEEVVVVCAEEETEPEEAKQSEEKEEVETQDKVEEERPAVEPETKVEETPIEEETGTLEEAPKAVDNSNVEEIPEVEEKPTSAETEEKPVSTIVAEPKKENAAIRKPDAVATRSEGAISNDVIEETKSKLMEKKRNKVLALVGAFETVMQKPEEGSTRR
jgi:Plant calmodulin-binding domain